MIKAYSFVKSIETKRDILTQHNILLKVRNNKDIPSNKELKKIINENDILIIGIKIHITKEIILNINKPKIIATFSIGLDHIDEEVIKNPFIKIIHLKNANTISVAEHIFTLILALNKRILENNINIIPEDINNKTLGLIGAGNITKEVIKIAKAFQLNIICYTPHPNKHKSLKDINLVSFDRVLKESDIINISIPLKEDTRNLISKKELNQMKNNATLINTSRRDIINMNDLLYHLDTHKNFYAGLDIDIDKNDKNLTKSRHNLIITPHTAGTTLQAKERMLKEIINSILKEISK